MAKNKEFGECLIIEQKPGSEVFIQNSTIKNQK